jgi:glutathione S-transferase
MSGNKLFMAPGTCARVTCIALEEAGVPFETVVIRFMQGEHKSPAYKTINPVGKVPALVLDGETLTENVAIVSYLNECYPEARLLPEATTRIARAHQLADLCYCASTLHPLVTRIRMSAFFAGDDAAAKVYDIGCKAMTEHFDLIEARLAKGPWWYGEQWSAVDAYLYWIFWRVTGAEFDASPYPLFGAHAARMEERPAVQRALAREAAAQKILEDEGLMFVPKVPVRPQAPVVS